MVTVTVFEEFLNIAFSTINYFINKVSSSHLLVSTYPGTSKTPTHGVLLLIHQISVHFRILLLQSIKRRDQCMKYLERNFEV